jgi:hypothetical protein
MGYTCTEHKCKLVLCVLLALPKTGGEQKLVVWSWSDACVIADGLSSDQSYVHPLAPECWNKQILSNEVSKSRVMSFVNVCTICKH